MNLTNRRQFLQAATTTAAACHGFCWTGSLEQTLAASQKAPAEARSLAGAHEVMRGILREYRLAGASLAVAIAGKLVIAEGYGEAIVERRLAATPDTLFSTASVTKPFTAVAILKLADLGRLELDAPLVEVLAGVSPLPGHRINDRRFRTITVRHLLYHAAGFPHDVPLPEFRPGGTGSAQFGTKGQLAYRRLMGRPLTFDPGTASKYSNAGFLVAQFVVAHVSGEPYERFVQTRVLRPLGITGMHLEKPAGYGPREAHWYLAGGTRPAVHRASNWQASAADLVTFIANVAGSTGRTFLSEKMTQEMLALPPGIEPRPKGAHVGLGWDSVREFPNGIRFSKNGGKSGVHTWLEHLPIGVDWAVMYNTDPPEGVDLLGETKQRLLPLFAREVQAEESLVREAEDREPPAPLEEDDEALELEQGD